jgi:hypothetical protein
LGHAESAKEMKNLCKIWSEDLKGREYLGDQNVSEGKYCNILLILQFEGVDCIKMAPYKFCN